MNKRPEDKRSPKDNRAIDLIERIGVGLLYTTTELGQNNIAQIMGMGDQRVNAILKGIKKPNSNLKKMK